MMIGLERLTNWRCCCLVVVVVVVVVAIQRDVVVGNWDLVSVMFTLADRGKV
jgi:hypothetical protein